MEKVPKDSEKCQTESCEKTKCCKKEEEEIKGKIQRERAKLKEDRRNRKIPNDKCFKCKAKPDYKYRNNLLVCR